MTTAASFQPPTPMKTYTPPSLAEYGTAAAITADSRESTVDDTFFNRNGQPTEGQGGSLDTCVTANTTACRNR